MLVGVSTRDRWHEERQAAWVYRHIASGERDPRKAEMFRELAKAGDKQAAILEDDLRRAGDAVPEFAPKMRARFVAGLARRFGPRSMRSLLVAIKVRGLSVYSSDLQGHSMPVSTADIGTRHRGVGGGGALRAAVFGVNDGLVSNACLVLGVAGTQLEPRTILATGIAGLLAGAFSMAAGEYISVRSQRELFESQIAEEREELERYPAEEAEELALIYAARGVPLVDARALTRRLVEAPEQMLDTLAREELGLNPADLGSPWVAAISSFIAFAFGALVPLIPFFAASARRPLATCAVISAASLFTIGALVSLFSGRNLFLGGLRMLLIGAAAGVVTYSIGSWIGAGLLT